MPIDLDDLFTDLGRHADSIPLAPPRQARHRGRQRTQAMVTVVAVVCLVAVGVGGLVLRHDRQSTPAVPAGLTPVGTPIPFGGQARASIAAGTDGRVYTAWQTLNGRIRLNAVDLRTGAVAWPALKLGGPGDTLGSVTAMPQAVTVILDHPDGADFDRTLSVHDPADGRQRWKLALGTEDSVVVHASVVVRFTAATGRTEAFDWATGATRWALPAPADRPVRTLGMVTDENWAGYATGRVTASTDDRLVQVTETGKVVVRDITTGALRRTVTSAAPDTDPRILFGYDGLLYNEEHECCEPRGYRIRVTDLRTDRGTSRVLLTEGPGHQLQDMMPCGAQRLCILDQHSAGTATISAVATTDGGRIWQRTIPGEYLSMSYLNGYLLVGGAEGDRFVYDQDGKQVFSTPAGAVHWLDGNTLLLLPSRLSGPAGKVSIPNGKVTALGAVPASSDACAYTTDRLICPLITELRIWSLSG